MSRRLQNLWDEEDDYDLEEHNMRAGLVASILMGIQNHRQTRNSLRQRLYLCRAELMPNPRFDTPWHQLRQSRNDRAYITTMGVDVATFDKLLLSGFAQAWDTTAIPRSDTDPQGNARIGARSLDAPGALGLLLHYLNSTMSATSLQQIFALIPSTISRYVAFSQSILLALLRASPDGAISWPQNLEEFEQNSLIIQGRHPRLKGAFGSMDGLNLAVQTSSDPNLENATYSSWLHSHCVSSVFVFSPNGDIIACNLNAPGSWHDAKVAFPIYQKLRAHTPPGYYLVADTAFPCGATSGFAVKTPIKAGQRLPADPQERSEFKAFDRQLLSFRQTAEWGMRAIQGSFGRLRIPLDINDPQGRGDLLELCARLHNVRVRLVGINEVHSVYVHIWRQSEDARLWDMFERMLFRDVRAGDRVARFHFTEA